VLLPQERLLSVAEPVAPNIAAGSPHNKNARKIAGHNPIRLVWPHPYPSRAAEKEE
jgi:hypothetical protein